MRIVDKSGIIYTDIELIEIRPDPENFTITNSDGRSAIIPITSIAKIEEE